MPWSWRYEKADGSETTGPAETFPTQADAESWVGEAWPELAEAGVDAVTLLEDNRIEYGPMSLKPPEA